MCVLQYSRVRMKTIMTLGLGHYKFHNGENHFFQYKNERRRNTEIQIGATMKMKRK